MATVNVPHAGPAPGRGMLVSAGSVARCAAAGAVVAALVASGWLDAASARILAVMTPVLIGVRLGSEAVTTAAGRPGATAFVRRLDRIKRYSGHQD